MSPEDTQRGLEAMLSELAIRLNIPREEVLRRAIVLMEKRDETPVVPLRVVEPGTEGVDPEELQVAEEIAEASQRAVDAMEAALVHARAGEVESFMLIGIMNDGEVFSAYHGATAEVIGLCEMAKMRIILEDGEIT